MLAMHGPHHVAQNSTTTICLPFAAAKSTASPLIHSATCNGAAGSPISAAETTGAWQIASATIQDLIDERIG